MRIIDMHAHTTNKELWNLHVKYARLADLAKLAHEFRVEKIILMATYFPFKRGGVPNKILLERIKGKSLFKMFLSLDVMNKLDEGMAEIKAMADLPEVCGLKLYPGYQDFSFADERIFPLFEIVEKNNLPVAIHSGELHHCCPKDDRKNKEYKCKGKCRIDELGHLSRPKEAEKVIRKFPNVKFILSHLANPYFNELREVMAKHPNAYTDISGQFLSGSEDTAEYKDFIVDEIKKFLALENGTERVMFATDFPIQSYVDSIALVKALKLPPKDEEKIFWKNAAKILKL